MYLSNGNMVIRNATASDAPQLCLWWNDGEVMAHAGFPLGTGQTEEAIAASLAGDSDQTHRRLIIELAGVPVGEMNYRNKGNAAEIGIKICDRAQQNRGYGKKLLSMLIGELFKMGYGKIILDTNFENKRARHVYERLGFKQRRLNVNAGRNQLGVLQSFVDYELVPGDLRDFA